MSLYGSLFSGVTSLNAQSLALGDISENISNVNTVGFKASTTHFATLVSGGGDSDSVGGVKHISKQNVAGQGILQQTTNALDLGISGADFFVVNDNVLGSDTFGQTQFTRAGHFTRPSHCELNADRHLVNAADTDQMGWKLNRAGEFVDANNNLITPDLTSEADLVPMSFDDVAFNSQATENIHIVASFPATASVADTYSASVRVLDALSTGHSLGMDYIVADHVELAGSLDDGANGVTAFNLTDILTPASLASGHQASTTAVNLAFAHNAGSTWDVTVTASNGTVSAGGRFSVEFDVEGNLIGDALRQVDIIWDASPLAADSIVAIDLGNLTSDAGVAPSLDGSSPDVNDAGLVLKLDLSTTNLNEMFVAGDGAFLRFDQNGVLASTSTLETTINWDNDESFASDSTITLDFGEIGTKNGLSVGGMNFELRGISGDGIDISPFECATVEADGVVVAHYENGTSLPVFRIPLPDLNIPNSLGAPRAGPIEFDRFFGTMSGDVMAANAASARLIGRGGDDALVGGRHADRLFGNSGGDALYGGDGDDYLSGANGNDALNGGDGDDIVFGGDGDDRVFGSNGDDLFLGLSGHDQYDGGAGFDALDLASAAASVKSNGARIWTVEGDVAEITGFEHISGSMFDDVLKASGVSARLVGRAGDDALVGGEAADRLFGNSGEDALRGGDGDDRLSGGSEDDWLFGGAGDDVAFGGAGDDVIAGHAGDDVLMGGAGDDRIQGRQGTDELFGDAGRDRLQGGDGDDVIEGGIGDDHLFGGAGDDRISGGAGADRLVGGSGQDVFVIAPGGSDDVIYDWEVGADRMDLSAFGPLSFATDVQPLIQEIGAWTVLRFGADDTVSIRGVAATDLGSSDFILAA